jgi:mono/diheme cytochrome c family protein
MKYVLAILVVALVLGIGALLYTWSGIYDVAATEPHWDITSSFLETLRNSSIRAQSEDIHVPDSDGEATIEGEVVSHYHGMCRPCHGAPGSSPEEFAEGLYPAPPSLTSGEVQEERAKAETFWVVKHGIKMTGMPAFGPTHDDQDLWDLVNLTEKIPQIDPEHYRRQGVEKTGEDEEGPEHEEGHVHAEH